jgi:hypothetical protein
MGSQPRRRNGRRGPCTMTDAMQVGKAAIGDAGPAGGEAVPGSVWGTRMKKLGRDERNERDVRGWKDVSGPAPGGAWLRPDGQAGRTGARAAAAGLGGSTWNIAGATRSGHMGDRPTSGLEGFERRQPGERVAPLPVHSLEERRGRAVGRAARHAFSPTASRQGPTDGVSRRSGIGARFASSWPPAGQGSRCSTWNLAPNQHGRELGRYCSGEENARPSDFAAASILRRTVGPGPGGKSGAIVDSARQRPALPVSHPSCPGPPRLPDRRPLPGTDWRKGAPSAGAPDSHPASQSPRRDRRTR